MRWVVAVPLVLAVVVLSACASTPAPPPLPLANPHPFDNVRRLAVVSTGETALAVTEHSAEPGRTFNEILKWGVFRDPWWHPLADLVHRGINWLLEVDRKSDAGASLTGITPRDVVASALAWSLIASGQYDEVSLHPREPLG